MTIDHNAAIDDCLAKLNYEHEKERKRIAAVEEMANVILDRLDRECTALEIPTVRDQYAAWARDTREDYTDQPFVVFAGRAILAVRCCYAAGGKILRREIPLEGDTVYPHVASCIFDLRQAVKGSR
jgi:hypothetical protein